MDQCDAIADGLLHSRAGVYLFHRIAIYWLSFILTSTILFTSGYDHHHHGLLLNPSNCLIATDYTIMALTTLNYISCICFKDRLYA